MARPLEVLRRIDAKQPVVDARATDPQPYTVTIAKTGSDDMDATLAASAQLVTLNGKVPVPPFALIARARSDIPRLQTALDSFGYYLNKVVITIGGHALTDPGLADYLDKVPEGTNVSVDVAIEKGPLFHLGKVEIDGAVPDAGRLCPRESRSAHRLCR